MYVCMLRAVCFDKGLKVILEEKERREGVKSQDESLLIWILPHSKWMINSKGCRHKDYPLPH